MYTPINIETYLEREHIKVLPQEVKDKIREVRCEWEYMSPEIFRELHTTVGVVKRLKKLKKLRSLYTDGKIIVYFNSYKETFDVVGKFLPENEG